MGSRLLLRTRLVELVANKGRKSRAMSGCNPERARAHTANANLRILRRPKSHSRRRWTGLHAFSFVTLAPAGSVLVASLRTCKPRAQHRHNSLNRSNCRSSSRNKPSHCRSKLSTPMYQSPRTSAVPPRKGFASTARLVTSPTRHLPRPSLAGVMMFAGHGSRLVDAHTVLGAVMSVATCRSEVLRRPRPGLAHRPRAGREAVSR